MKDKKYLGPDSIFQKKGFYIALYSCIGVLLVAAVAITYSSLADYGESENKIAQDIQVEYEDSQLTSGSGYLDPADGSGLNVELASIPDDLLVMPDATVTESEPETDTQENNAQEETAQQNAQPETSAPAPQENSDTDTSPEEAMYSDEDAAFVSSSLDEAVEEILADPVFNVYSGEEDMIWPVEGDIVMEYSVDKVIYDMTLDQYRTNDSICIAATAGTQVKSAADGVVRTVSTSREDGNYIVVEHGNGWYTTYSQLQEGILVAEGDVVTAGQVIGGVGTPSIYSVLLGNHLNFRISKDDATVNPVMVLQH